MKSVLLIIVFLVGPMGEISQDQSEYTINEFAKFMLCQATE